MSSAFRSVLCRLSENGFTDEALAAATVANATYWDRDLWGYLANVRSRGRCNSFATVPRGRTRLMEAAHSGRLDRLEWLLALAGWSSIATIDFDGRTALYHAIEASHLECVARLVSAGACISDMAPSVNPFSLLFQRDAEFLVSATHVLLRSSKMVTSIAVRQAMLLEAIRHGQVECVEIMLATGLRFMLRLSDRKDAEASSDAEANADGAEGEGEDEDWEDEDYDDDDEEEEDDNNGYGNEEDEENKRFDCFDEEHDTEDSFIEETGFTDAEQRRLRRLPLWLNIIAKKFNQLQNCESREDCEDILAKDPLFRRNYAAVLRALLSAGARIPKGAKSPLLYALTVSDVEAVEFLLINDPVSRELATCAEHRITILRTVYHGLDRQKSFAIAKLLLNAGAPACFPDESHERQPIYYAISAVSPECVRSLIAQGALDIGVPWGDEPAVGNELVEVFLSAFMNAPIRTDPTLIREQDALDVLLHMFKRVTPVDNLSLRLASTLHYMCLYGFPSSVRFLLDRGTCPHRILKGKYHLFDNLNRCRDDESGARIVGMLTAHNVPFQGLTSLVNVVSANRPKTIQALIDAGATLTYREHVTTIIMAMFCLNASEDPINGPLALRTANALITRLLPYGSRGCTENSLGKMADAIIAPLFEGRIAGPVKTIIEAFQRTLDEAQEETPKHTMLLRLLLDELGESPDDFNAIRKTLSGLLFPNSLDEARLLFQLGGPVMFTPKRLEALIRSFNCDPGDVLKYIIFPALKVPVQDAITDDSFLHICEHGFDQSLEAILAVAGYDARMHWAQLEPLKRLVEIKGPNLYDRRPNVLPVLKILLRYGFGSLQAHIISAIEACCKMDYMCELLKGMDVKLSTISGGLDLLYQVYEKCAVDKELNVEILQVLQFHGLDVNRICSILVPDKNAIISCSKRCAAASLDFLLSTSTMPIDARILNHALGVCFRRTGHQNADLLATMSLLQAAGANFNLVMLQIPANQSMSETICRAFVILGSSNPDITIREKIRRWVKSSVYPPAMLLALAAQLEREAT